MQSSNIKKGVVLKKRFWHVYMHKRIIGRRKVKILTYKDEGKNYNKIYYKIFTAL